MRSSNDKIYFFTTKLTCWSNFSISSNTPRFFLTDDQMFGVRGQEAAAGPHPNIRICFHLNLKSLRSSIIEHHLDTQAMFEQSWWILMLKASRSGHHRHNYGKKDHDFWRLALMAACIAGKELAQGWSLGAPQRWEGLMMRWINGGGGSNRHTHSICCRVGAEQRCPHWKCVNEHTHTPTAFRERNCLLWLHMCVELMSNHMICYPLVSVRTHIITFPAPHCLNYCDFKANMATVIKYSAGFYCI